MPFCAFKRPPTSSPSPTCSLANSPTCLLPHSCPLRHFQQGSPSIGCQASFHTERLEPLGERPAQRQRSPAASQAQPALWLYLHCERQLGQCQLRRGHRSYHSDQQRSGLLRRLRLTDQLTIRSARSRRTFHHRHCARRAAQGDPRQGPC